MASEGPSHRLNEEFSKSNCSGNHELSCCAGVCYHGQHFVA